MVPRYTVSPSETVNNYQTEKLNGPGTPGTSAGDRAVLSFGEWSLMHPQADTLLISVNPLRFTFYRCLTD